MYVSFTVLSFSFGPAHPVHDEVAVSNLWLPVASGNAAIPACESCIRGIAPFLMVALSQSTSVTLFAHNSDLAIGNDFVGLACCELSEGYRRRRFLDAIVKVKVKLTPHCYFVQLAVKESAARAP